MAEAYGQEEDHCHDLGGPKVYVHQSQDPEDPMVCVHQGQVVEGQTVGGHQDPRQADGWYFEGGEVVVEVACREASEIAVLLKFQDVSWARGHKY
jgi:hypothetical protein